MRRQSIFFFSPSMSWHCRVPTRYEPAACRAAADTGRAQDNVAVGANKPRPRTVQRHKEAQGAQHGQAGDKPAWTGHVPAKYDAAESRTEAGAVRARGSIVAGAN